jgi:hypothetical protein
MESTELIVILICRTNGKEKPLRTEEAVDCDDGEFV